MVTRAYVGWWSNVQCFDSLRVASNTNSSRLQDDMLRNDRPPAHVRPGPLDYAGVALSKFGPSPLPPQPLCLTSCFTQHLDVCEEEGDVTDSHNDQLSLRKRQKVLHNKRPLVDIQDESKVNLKHQKKASRPSHHDHHGSFLLGDLVSLWHPFVFATYLWR